MRFDEPGFLQRAYRDDHGLSVRMETHRLYSIDRGNLFETITDEAARQVVPMRVLDVGAGIGAWYHALRERLGPVPHYVGVDQSEGMVVRLREVCRGDPHAEAAIGDAQALSWPDESFDWVGLHFMLYHVPDIRLALNEAWRILRQGGLLLAATTAERPYRELFDLVARGLESLGYKGARIESPGVRFSLEHGHRFFPEQPEVLVHPAGLRFDSVEPAVRFLASGPLDSALEQNGAPESLREDLLAYVGLRVSEEIQRSGSFLASSESGFFMLRKAGR